MLAIGKSSANPPDPFPVAPGSSSPEAQLSGACALLAILVHTQSANQSASKADIESGFQKLSDLKKQLADAVQHAKDASEHTGFFGFLGDIFGSDIAQIAGAVAGIAAVVASGGAAAPLLAIALAEALQVGAKVGAELGLDPKICLVISLASVAVGFCTGSGTGKAVSDLAHGIEVGAKVAQSGATIAGGALHGVAGYYHGQQLNYQADAAGYQGRTDATSLSIDDAIARLERALRTEQSETNTVSEIAKNDADTKMTLSERI